MTTTSERESAPAGDHGDEVPIARTRSVSDDELGNPNLSLKNPAGKLRVALGALAFAVALAVVGAVTRVLGADDAGGVVIAVAIGLAVLSLAFLPAIIYSRRDPERARRTAEHQREAQERRLRRHPVAYVVGVTVVAGVLLPLRLGLRRSADHEQAWSLGTMILIGVAAAMVMAVFMTLAVRRARRHRPADER